VSWSTSADVRDLVAAAGGFLAERPVEHTVLLTEAAYLTAWPSAAADQLHGWWTGADGAVAGAFLRAPAHPAILSMMSDAAIDDLAAALPGLDRIGVDARLAGRAAAAWGLAEHSRVTLYRLEELPGITARGQARIATEADRDLLTGWFRRLMAAYPDDPTELAYAVDDPLAYGGITLWEVDGTPVAMAGCSRQVAGMVRLSTVYAPDDDTYGEAAFAAACARAQRQAQDVLVFSAAPGFRPVLDRVTLAATATPGR
jgi:hypothetical protein